MKIVEYFQIKLTDCFLGTPMLIKNLILIVVTLLFFNASSFGANELVLDVWPGKAPGENKLLGPEKIEPGNPNDKSSTIRLSNISKPTLTVFQPAPGKSNGTSVIVCPGGGHRILAWDKEGTEVGEWLSKFGTTVFVLKYRVPARDENKRYEAAVQDAQRSVALVRTKAKEMKLNENAIGILGFSAGGETAGLTALFENKIYPTTDNIDDASSRPDFAVLIYPGGLLDKEQIKLQPHVKASKKSPPMFFAHASDDKVSPLNSVLTYAELKKNNIPAELHIYALGGHGFGLRPISGHAATSWPESCIKWLSLMGFLPPSIKD